jgi:hypothetical protein
MVFITELCPSYQLILSMNSNKFSLALFFFPLKIVPVLKEANNSAFLNEVHSYSALDTAYYFSLALSRLHTKQQQISHIMFFKYLKFLVVLRYTPSVPQYKPF